MGAAVQPVEENGALVTLTRGSDPTIDVPFSAGVAKVRWNGTFPAVVANSLLGGVPFVAVPVTSKLRIAGQPVVVVGSVVTRSDGYTGTVPPSCGAGVKYVVD